MNILIFRLAYLKYEFYSAILIMKIINMMNCQNCFLLNLIIFVN